MGYILSPALLDLVSAAPGVKAEALPFFRIAFLFSSGMLVFYMLCGSLDPIDIWAAILLGHATRRPLSVIRFKQGKWRNIAVDIEQKATKGAS